MRLIFLEKAKIVETYSGEFIRSVNGKWAKPAVIAINRYIEPSRMRRFSKKAILVRDGYECQYCGLHDRKNLTLDHVVPKSKGGVKSWENIVACCRSCNQIKGSKDLNRSGLKLLKKPKEPMWPTIDDKEDQWRIYIHT